MNLLVPLLAIAVGVCQGSRFNYAGFDQDCSNPTWKCDCKLVYGCDGKGIFPDDVGADPSLSGYLKDLAPKEYPLGISGKRWRKKKSSSEKFCKKECEDRMNAFLCLDDGTLTDYSYSAVCLKLLGVDGGPFTQDGTATEPCCTIFLQYGPQWCTKKCYRAVDTARCLSLSTIDFSGTTSALTNVFSVEGGCEPTNAGDGSFTWCADAPTCAPPVAD